jgi:hypothetical protein
MSNEKKLQEAIEGACRRLDMELQGEVTSGHQEMYIDNKDKKIILNPGAGKCEEGTFEQACRNIDSYIEDCGVPLKIGEKHEVPDENNRYMFKLDFETGMVDFRFEVLMPGVDLEKVRYLELENQDIWDFPRIIMDDESYVWKYGLINKKDAYDKITSTIRYCREQMQLVLVCGLLVSALLAKEKLQMCEGFGNYIFSKEVEITSLMIRLEKGYRKTDIALLDKLTEEITGLLE